MTRDTFAEIMAVLEVAHGKDFGAQEREVWWSLIRELPDDAAKAATLEVCRRSPYPPRPAHIVNAVLGEPGKADIALADEAVLARSEFLAAFSDWESVDYGPVVNAVVREMGGIEEVGRRIVEGDKWWMRDFERLYLAFRRGGVPLALAGPIRPQVVQAQIDDHAAGRWKVPELPPNMQVRKAGSLIALQSGLSTGRIAASLPELPEGHEPSA